MRLHSFEEFTQYFNKLISILGGIGKAESAIAHAIDASPSAIKQIRHRKVINATTLAAIRCAILEGRLPE